MIINNPNLLVYISTIEDKNLSYNIKNIKEITDNRLKLAKKLNINIKDIIYMNQVHLDNIEIIQDNQQNYFLQTDALITDIPNIPLLVTVADCIPIFLYDNSKKVISLIHAGRSGTYLDIVTKTVNKMQDYYKTDPKDIEAYFGPSIKSCCYEVDYKIVEKFKEKFKEKFCQNNRLNLQEINKDLLKQAGVKDENIKISQICTCCNGELYYSYRKNKTVNRFGAIFMLK